MERRALLIGSGTVFATVLAGCTGSDDSGDDENGGGVDDDGGGGGTDDGNGNGGSTGDVPGFDKDKLDLDEYGLKIDHVKRDGSTVHVEVEATETALAQENLEELLAVVADAIVDPDAFKVAIGSIDVTVVDDAGNAVLSFFVDVEWAVAYVQDELTLEEFTEKVSETAS